MTHQLPRYVSMATIAGKVYFKAQRANSVADQRNGSPYWRYQRHFKTLEAAVAFLASVEAKR